MKFSLVMIVLLLVVAGSAAQQSEPSETPSVEQASAPATLAGQSSPQGLQIEGVAPNYVSGGVSITQMFSDNAELTSNDRISDLSWEIMPHLGLVHSSTRLTYDLNAMGGFVVNRTLNDRNRSTESGAADLSYRLTQFVTMRLSDSFMNTTGLWSGLTPGTGTAGGIGAVQAPNSSVFSYERFRSNTALGELSGQLSASSFAGIRAVHSYTWFPDGASSPLVGALYNGQIYTAEAFYNRHFTARNWGGITLRAQRFDLESSLGHTDSGTALFLYGVNLRPNMSISFFVGPELSVTSAPQGIVLPSPTFARRQWTAAAGAVFAWQGQRTSANASFTRQTNSGGGLPSAVLLTSGTADILKQFGPRFAVGPGFSYTESAPIIQAQTLRTYSGLLQFTYRVDRNYTFNGGYARDGQIAVGTNNSTSADRVWISFSLDFLRPMGR